MNKTLFIIVMIPAILYIFYNWYLVWFKPKKFSEDSEKYRSRITSIYPGPIKELIYFVTGNLYSKVNIWEARFIYSIALAMALFGFSAIFWSTTFR
jgi:hypothetical protein